MQCLISCYCLIDDFIIIPNNYKSRIKQNKKQKNKKEKKKEKKKKKSVKKR